MPTYQNDTEATIQVGLALVEPHKQIQTFGYYSITGLTKIFDDPRIIPAYFSQVYTGGIGSDSGDIAVPLLNPVNNKPLADNYAISIQCIAGQVAIELNGLTTYPTRLIAGATKVLQCQYARTIETLKVVYEAAASKVIVEVQPLY